MKHLCILLIKFYRRFISPHKGGSCCRFVPSCSAYAMEAFQKRGFFVGLVLTVWRILRCNPLCVGGYDPVPERGLRYKGSREIPIDDENVDLCDCHSQPDPCREDDGKGGEQAAHRNEEASYTKDSEEN